MSIPPPPPPDPRSHRYSTRSVRLARQLHAGGWPIVRIRDIIESDTGQRPAENTVLAWVDERYADLLRQLNRESAARRRGRPLPPTRTFTDRELLRLREEDNLTFKAIAAVARRFYGVELTEHQVRLRLDALGAPKNPNKARAARELAARRKAAA